MNAQHTNEDLFTEAFEAWENHELQKAFELFLQMAGDGDSSAQLNLGYFYDEGIYVPVDKNRAIAWYKKAYHQGDGCAATNIAIYYRTIRAYKKALWWFHQAVRLLDHDAFFDLGQLYEKGHGVKKNIPKAIWYYHQAVTADNITEDTVESAQERIETLTFFRK